MTDLDPAEADWTTDKVSDAALRAVVRGDNGVLPARSVGLYARWWQLETWLRELSYAELRPLHGAAWSDVVRAARGRQAKDAAFTHMAGADNENPLAYLDYSQLRLLIADHWPQLGYALIERQSWEGASRSCCRSARHCTIMQVFPLLSSLSRYFPRRRPFEKADKLRRREV